MVDLGTDANGSAPAEFELQGRWAMVRDLTASNGVALDGVSEEIADADADMSPKRWHRLAVRIVDNEFTVFFDGQWAFTGFDRALSQPGSIALRTRGDSVTRFDKITITPLAVQEETQLSPE
jgi:hypothetical protein